MKPFSHRVEFAHTPGRVADCAACHALPAPRPAFTPVGEGLVYKIVTSQTVRAVRAIPCWQSRVEAMAKRVRESIALHVGELWHHQMQRRGRYKPVFVTLTYAPNVAWGRKDFSEYVNRVSQWARRQGFNLRYTFVLELQKRGAPHYHVLFFIPARLAMPRADKRGWWRHGMTNTKSVTGSPANYMAKYLSKGGVRDELPTGARLHGRGGHSREARVCMYRAFLPKWLRDVTEPGDRWDCKTGGIRVSRNHGMQLRSPFELEHFYGGFAYITKVADGPRWLLSPWDMYPCAA